MKDKRNVKGLIKALSYDKDRDVIKGAIEALGVLADAQSAEPLWAYLNDKHHSYRHEAVMALGRINDSRVVDMMSAILENSSEYEDDMRISAAYALLAKCDIRSFKTLLGALKDKNHDVRKVSAQILGKLGDARAVEPLCSALKDAYNDVKGSIAGALGLIGDARAREVLCVLLKDESCDVRNTAAWALERVGIPDDRLVKINCLIANEKWDDLVSFGEDAVEPLCALFNDREMRIRRGAEEALAKIGKPALDYLYGLFESSEDDVRKSAAAAAARIGIPGDREHKLKYLLAAGRWDDIFTCGKDAIEPLLKALGAREYYIRYYSAMTLIKLFKEGEIDQGSKALILSNKDAVVDATHFDGPSVNCGAEHEDSKTDYRFPG
jgi:HEAT repeat protein